MIRLLPRLLLACLFSLAALAPVQAADESLEAMTELLKMRLGSDDVDTPVPTGIDGVYQTRFDNKIAYLIEGGRYVFIGDLVDLKMARNMSEMSRRQIVVDALAEYGEDRLVIYPADNEELAVLNVFTDTSCGYCQRLHQEIRHLQAAGISVRYFPYPRGGNRGPGYEDMRKVWCAEDPLLAMNIAKGSHSGRLSGESDCASAQYVDDGFQLGNRIGVNATPALYTDDGAKFNGYVPYQQLIPQLVKQ